MNKLATSILFSILSFYCVGQNNQDKVYTIVEEPPTFKYGMAGFYWYISDNLQYPEQSFNNKTEGRVMVQFVVNKNGEVIEEKVVQGLNAELDAEALRLMQSCPNWIPGRTTKGGETCDVRMVVPIIFKAYEPTEADNAKSLKFREKAIKKWEKKHKSP